MVNDPARSARIQELFLQAVEVPEATRAEFISARCAGDTELESEVASLLRFAVESNAERGPITGGVAAQVMRLAPGDRVGEFTLSRPLGSGASGDVFLATQDSPRRDVALKIQRAGRDPDTIARFRLEGAALARMSHENVARVYAVGEDGGRLFLAMELLPGEPITDYADEHRLTIDQRLAMFIKLCDALEHVHQNGLIHRDLKPSNVVVMESSAGPQPKLLDFGIVKAIGEAQDAGGRTLDGAILGTIEYASPEQLEGSRSVDTRSDLYSAGVILHELLVGSRPHRLGSQGLGAFLATVRDTEVARPSARLVSQAASVEAVAGLRRATPVRLLQELRTDLDWIVAKALRKSPRERYASAGDLRADLQRYLRGEPVVARPPSVRYRLMKGIVRHRAAVIASATLLLAVTAGLLATRQQAAIANARLVELERLATDLVSSVNEIIDIPGAIESKQRLVASAAKTLESIAQREGGVALSDHLADAYERVGQLRADPYMASLGQTAQGVADLSRAAVIRERIFAADPREENAVKLMHTWFTLALTLQSGHPGPPDADSLLRMGHRLGASIVERDSTAYDAMRILSMLYDLHAEYEMVCGQWQSTLWCINRSYDLRLAMARQDGGSDETMRLIAESHGRLAYAAMDPAIARHHAMASLRLMEAYFQRHPFSYKAYLDIAYACRNAAYALRRNGEADSALVLLRRCVAARRVMAAADRRDVRSRYQLAIALDWLADGFVGIGRPDSAIAYGHMAMAIHEEAATSPDAPHWSRDVLRIHQTSLARAMHHAGRYASAESLYSILCSNPPMGMATDAIKAWRDRVGRAHNRLAARDTRGADTVFAGAEPILQWTERYIAPFTKDAVPYADLALAYVHLAQVSERDPERRLRLLQHASELPNYDGDQRAIRPLIQNELACALADRGHHEDARRLLTDAMKGVGTQQLKSVIRWNLGTLAGVEESGARAEGGRYRTQPYDPSRDPYAKLDLTVFRMVTVWGEHPVPPPSRRVPQPAYVSESLRRNQASPSFASPRTVRSEMPSTSAVASAERPRM